MASNAKVVGASHGARLKATDMCHTQISDATTAKASHLSSAEAAHVNSTKAADVAAAKAAHTTATVPSAAASGLCTRGKQAPSQHCAC